MIKHKKEDRMIMICRRVVSTQKKLLFGYTFPVVDGGTTPMEMHAKATDGAKSPDLVEVWGTMAAVGDAQPVIMDNTVE